jgi:hypothetical protein
MVFSAGIMFSAIRSYTRRNRDSRRDSPAVLSDFSVIIHDVGGIPWHRRNAQYHTERSRGVSPPPLWLPLKCDNPDK